MFQIGDAVVYPPYGAGYVKDIVEEENIAKEQETYYMIEFLLTDMSILVPSDSKKFRSVNSKAALKKALTAANDKDFEKKFPSNKNRMKEYEKILIEGDLQSVSNIWNILFEKKSQNGLNQMERDVYQKVEEMLVSEIMVVNNYSLEDARIWLHANGLN